MKKLFLRRFYFIILLGCMFSIAITIKTLGYGDWVYTNTAPGVHDNLSLIQNELRKLPEEDLRMIEEDLDFIRGQIVSNARIIPAGQYPVHTLADGSWMLQNVKVWVASHWVGMLWLAYRETGDSQYRDWAERWMKPLSARIYDTWTHDHGFLFGLSFIKGSEMIEDKRMVKKYHTIALAAADTYTKKANPQNGFISWHDTWQKKDNRDETVIDSMMDVQLMWWASEQTKDPKYIQVGLKQVEAVRRFMVRPDFSTSHGLEFNPKTGEVIGERTFQGYADNSCWSRGQAWAIYGFSQIYAKTGNPDYLKTARGVAEYFLNNLPEDKVPYWDFQAPLIPKELYPRSMVRDSSAAAIAASGLLELARFEEDPFFAVKYFNSAMEILRSLSSPNYLSRGTLHQGVLLHGCQHFKRQDRDPDNIDSCNIWGDYYFMEALDKLSRWQTK